MSGVLFLSVAGGIIPRRGRSGALLSVGYTLKGEIEALWVVSGSIALRGIQMRILASLDHSMSTRLEIW